MNSEELERAIVPAEKRGLLGKEVLKDAIKVLPIWLGRRSVINSDLEAFQMAMSYYRRFDVCAGIEFPQADEIKESDARLLLTPMASDLAKELSRIKSPLAIFIITTEKTAESSWLEQFPQNLQEYRRTQNKKDDTFVYKIIMPGGGWGFKKYEAKDPSGRFWNDEVIAYELGGVYLYYNGDAPTAGSARLVEFMNRVLGEDLPGREFPDYSREDLARMAWNINRENFNAGPKEGSIPKYPIGENGRPIFPF